MVSLSRSSLSLASWASSLVTLESIEDMVVAALSAAGVAMILRLSGIRDEIYRECESQSGWIKKLP